MNRTLLVISLVCLMSGGLSADLPNGAAAVPLPNGVRAVWEVEKAYRLKTPTREQVCLNGLWRWQPAEASREAIPAGRWGYFKVPGCWPGITDYMQKDSQK